MAGLKAIKGNKINANRGNQLRIARHYRMLTQSEVVDGIEGVTQSDLSKYENGDGDAITDHKIKEIMKRLRFPIDWLDRQCNDVYDGVDQKLHDEYHNKLINTFNK